MARRARLLGVALLSVPLLMTAVGCGGRGSTPFVNSPSPDAPLEDFASYLSGDWLVTLNSDAPTGIPTTMTLNAGPAAGERLPVTGAIAGTELRDGGFTTAGAQPTLRFTTGDLTLEGEIGPDQIPGPITWIAVVEEGRLLGTATGPDGHTGEWRAEKR